jgi:hypothetical protein
MFRFSIRELMLVTLVAGMALGWWLDRQRVRGEIEELSWKGVALARGLEFAGYCTSFTDNELNVEARRSGPNTHPYSFRVRKSGSVIASHVLRSE